MAEQKAAVDTLQKSKVVLEGHIRDLQRRMEEETHRAEKYKNKVEDKNDRIKQLENAVYRYNEKIKQLEGGKRGGGDTQDPRLQDALKQIESLRHQLHEAKMDNLTTGGEPGVSTLLDRCNLEDLAQLQARFDALQAKHSELLAAYRGKEGMLANTSGETENLRSEATYLRTQLAKVTGQIADSLRVQAASFTKELDSLRGDKATSQKKLQDAYSRIGELELQLERVGADHKRSREDLALAVTSIRGELRALTGADQETIKSGAVEIEKKLNALEARPDPLMLLATATAINWQLVLLIIAVLAVVWWVSTRGWPQYFTGRSAQQRYRVR